jgi:uncharacterized protein (TIGR02444 family)
MEMQKQLDNPLWQYMLRIYQKEGVEAALLALQEQGFNVLILLSLCWVSANNKTLNQSQIGGLTDRVDHSLISEFRQWRKTLKEDSVFSKIYKKALNFELMLEQTAVAELYEYLSRLTLEQENPEDLKLLLDHYSQLINLPANDKFGELLSAVCD